MRTPLTVGALFFGLGILGGCVEPVDCTLPPKVETGEPMNGMTCTGIILDSGSMDQSDEPTDAELWCERSLAADITCCSFHLYGEGEWFVTNGSPAASGGVPDESEGGRAAGACTVLP